MSEQQIRIEIESAQMVAATMMSGCAGTLPQGKPGVLYHLIHVRSRQIEGTKLWRIRGTFEPLSEALAKMEPKPFREIDFGQFNEGVVMKDDWR